jgi:hypothetical protein
MEMGVGVGLVTVTRRMGWSRPGFSELDFDGSGGRRCIRVSIGGGHVNFSTTVQDGEAAVGVAAEVACLGNIVSALCGSRV